MPTSEQPDTTSVAVAPAPPLADPFPPPHGTATEGSASAVQPVEPGTAWAREDGLIIPDMKLLRRIGSGSYGEVWMAQAITGALRAVKVVWREDFEQEKTFHREFI